MFPCSKELIYFPLWKQIEERDLIQYTLIQHFTSYFTGIKCKSLTMAYKTLCNLLSLPLQDPALPPITLPLFLLLLPIIPHIISSVSKHTLPQSFSIYCVLCLKYFPPESNMASSISSTSFLLSITSES